MCKRTLAFINITTKLFVHNTYVYIYIYIYIYIERDR